MTKAKITAILITLTIAALFTNMQAQTTVDMALDRSEMLVGEQVRLTTTVNTDTKSRVEWPALLEGDTIQAGLEIVRREQPDTTYANEGKRITLKQTYLLTAFDSALYAIPPLEVIVNGQRIQARGRCGLKVIPIPVDTVHVDNFAPPYSSLEHPFTWSNSLLLTSLPLWILAILLIFFAIRISMFKPIQRRIVVPPPTPPLKKAIEAIEEIKQMDILNDNINKTFFVRLTELVRTYLNDRYGCAAMEKTTREIMAEMRENQNLTPQQLLELRALLDTADYVKFARSRPGVSERQTLLERTERFLDETHDEAMEHPLPIVKIVTLSGGTQRSIKALLYILGSLTLVTAIGLMGTSIWRIYSTFL